MKIETDRDACIGAGQCVMAAPGVFDQSEEDGRVVVLVTEPGEDQLAEVEDAAETCPTSAITVHP